MQFQANSDLLVGVGDRYHSDGGPRYFAWPMRNMMVCTFTCPNATQLGACKWLQPQSVWTAGLVNYVAWADTNLTNATDGLHTTFHNPALTGGQQIVPPQASGTWIDFWQTGYFGITLGWAMKMGAASVDSRFTAFYAWQVQSIMARTTSGSHPPLSFTGTISGNTLTALTYLNGISLHNFTNVGVGSSISAIFTAAGLPGSPITVTAAGSGGSSVNSQVSALVSDINANSTLAAFGISAVVGTTWGGGDFYVLITSPFSAGSGCVTSSAVLSQITQSLPGPLVAGMTISDVLGNVPLGTTVVSGSGTSWTLSTSSTVSTPTIMGAASGFTLSHQSPYQYSVYNGSVGTGLLNIEPSWAAAEALNAALVPAFPDWESYNGSSINVVELGTHPGEAITYVAIALAEINMAAFNSVSGAAANAAVIQSSIPVIGFAIDWKWQIAT